MRLFASITATCLLAGCAPLPPPPQPPYHAVGTEPFWDLLIDQHDVTFTLSGSQPIREPTPDVIVGIAGEIYRTPRIDVNIVHGQCSDGMSDRVFPTRSRSASTPTNSTAVAGFNAYSAAICGGSSAGSSSARLSSSSA